MHGRLTDSASFSQLIFPDCDISLYAPFTVPCMPYASHFPTGFVTSRVSVCVSLCLMLYALPCSGAFHCFRFYAFPHMPYRYLSNFRTDTVLSHVLKERLWLQREEKKKQSPPEFSSSFRSVQQTDSTPKDLCSYRRQRPETEVPKTGTTRHQFVEYFL